MSADTEVFVQIWIGEWGRSDMGGAVVSIDIEDTDQGTDKATLLLEDPGGSNSIGIQPGQQIHIVMGWLSEYALMFVGRIREREIVSGDRSRLRIICFDDSIRMNQPPENTGRTHAGTLEAILTAIVEPYNIALGKVEIDPMPEYSEDDPIRQRNRSDWTLIQQLATRHNARAFIEPNAVEGKPPTQEAPPGLPQLYFISEDALLAQDPAGHMTYCEGFSQLLTFEMRDVGRTATASSNVAVIDPLTGLPCVEEGTAAAESAPPVPSDNLIQRAEAGTGAVSPGDLAQRSELAANADITPTELRPRRHHTGLASSCERARQAVLPDRTRLLGYHGTGMAMGSVRIRAKDTVELDGLPSNGSGVWYLKRVNHIVQRTRIDDQTQSTYRTKIVATR